MNAETILHSDVLDIIFENRNKQYGAYTLRREYDKRLIKAMGSIATLVLLFCIGNYIQQLKGNTFSVHDNIQTPGPVIFSIAPPPKPIQAPPKTQAPVAQVKNLPPVIVPDKEVEKPIATNEEMVDKVISNVDRDGPAASTANQQAVSEPIQAGPPVATSPEPAPEILRIAEVMPEFPGGTAALIRFLNKNLQVPENAMEPGEHVRVPVQFVVNKEGLLSDIVFQGTADNAFKKEIQRVLAKMPRWKPGIQNGRTVAVYYTIPVIFDMTEN